MHDVPPWVQLQSLHSFSVNKDRLGLPQCQGRGPENWHPASRPRFHGRSTVQDERGVKVAFGALLCLLSWTSTMASTFTGATSSTGPSAGSNRKRAGGDLSSNPKKPKKPTKLDNLKAELKITVGNLKDRLINARDNLLDEKFAKQSTKYMYTSYLNACDALLTGENPTQPHLALFQVHFANQFESEEVLRIRMDQGVLPC